MIRNIAIFGAGGFGKEVATIIHKINEIKPTWNLLGFYDDGELVNTSVSNYGQVLGGYDALNARKGEISIVFAIGKPTTIKTIKDKLINPNILYPNLIHPEVYFADKESLKMGIGNVIVRGCSISCDVEIGDFNQFNSISALAHDVRVGSFNVFMPLTRVSGEVVIGDYNTFGINCIILQTIKVGSNKRIGPSSVLMTKPRREGLYMGNPARLTKL
ncbi:MAG: sugar O-acyltransferase (sialic acid O-acetyltransferase NeuD family) [Salibacteraceae bacterium]|jgi:sugar O-acyltransferase (sialic acid O-acetyltransferase NeuD family)